MREIKFRGQTYDTPPHWVFGDLYHYTTGEPAINYPHPHKKWLESEPVRPDTVGQFTGLLDSTGNEIYEGDVIRICGSNGIVAYGEGEFIVRFEKAPSLLSHCVGGDFSNPERVTACRVIGNIHDNPELLK